MECPKCGRQNPPTGTAIRCDCGHSFIKTEVVESVHEPLSVRPRRLGAIQFIWLLPLLGAIVGGVELLEVLASANGAPQQAAGAGLALAFVVIPFCFAQAVIGLAGQ